MTSVDIKTELDLMTLSLEETTKNILTRVDEVEHQTAYLDQRRKGILVKVTKEVLKYLKAIDEAVTEEMKADAFSAISDLDNLFKEIQRIKVEIR